MERNNTPKAHYVSKLITVIQPGREFQCLLSQKDQFLLPKNNDAFGGWCWLGREQLSARHTAQAPGAGYLGVEAGAKRLTP